MDRPSAAVGNFHPALNLALDGFPAEVSGLARAALIVLLRERCQGNSEAAWSSSRLTGDGFPVEVTFTTGDHRLRYTVEPGSAASDPRQRLDTALDIVNRLSPVPVPLDAAELLRELQSCTPRNSSPHECVSLLFGAWVGGRHGIEESQYKIYAEVPEGCVVGKTTAGVLTDREGEIPQPRLPDRAVSLRMVAYSPSSRAWELYYRVKSLAPYHAGAVLAPAGLASHSGRLLEYLRDAYGYSLTDRLPGESVGISYSLSFAPEKSEPSVLSVTLFFFARALWGADARIRQQFGRLSTAVGWDDCSYQKVTAPLARRRSWKTYHGIFGVTLTHAGRMALSIGVRPPEAEQVGEL